MDTIATPIAPDRSHIAPVDSREELIYLLSRASELEHDLACVYLFAAYSLKDASEGGMSADQAMMVRGWKRRLASVAVEEMLHLAQVSNLLTAIGGAPHFKRSNFPISASVFPLGMELSLEPFSEATIERMVCFEMPEAGILAPQKQQVYDQIRARVAGRLTAAIHGHDDARQSGTLEPYDIDFKTVGEFYHKILSGFLAIPEDRLFIGPPQAQANARYVDFGGRLLAVTSRESAQAAINMIVEQGEAPTHDHPDAHFFVFDTIRKEYESNVAGAASTGAPFAPVRPVISNPMTRYYDDTSGGNVITDPLTHDVADIFNTAYDTMLIMLLRFFAHLDESEEELRLMARGTMRLMASVLRPLGEALAKMPAGPDYPAMTAGPGFGYNRDVHLLAHRESAWIFVLERLQQLEAKIVAVSSAGDLPPQVSEAAAAIQSVGDHLVQFIPRPFAARMDFKAEGAATASIACEPDGPYLVTNLQRLTNSKGETLDVRRTLALCRCGGSNIKPYCDGTHARIGFSSAKSAARAKDQLVDYVGREITIHDNRGTCCHSGNCTDHLASVFKQGVEPWIDPDGASPEQIIDIVRQCPSGALSYSYHGTDYAGEKREQAIFVSKDGPYHVHGGIELQRETRNQGALVEHYALCRCGQSKNKPFCDGSHWYAKFQDEDN